MLIFQTTSPKIKSESIVAIFTTDYFPVSSACKSAGFLISHRFLASKAFSIHSNSYFSSFMKPWVATPLLEMKDRSVLVMARDALEEKAAHLTRM
jgi:hypothetical protein